VGGDNAGRARAAARIGSGDEAGSRGRQCPMAGEEEAAAGSARGREKGGWGPATDGGELEEEVTKVDDGAEMRRGRTRRNPGEERLGAAGSGTGRPRSRVRDRQRGRAAARRSREESEVGRLGEEQGGKRGRGEHKQQHRPGQVEHGEERRRSGRREERVMVMGLLPLAGASDGSSQLLRGRLAAGRRGRGGEGARSAGEVSRRPSAQGAARTTVRPSGFGRGRLERSSRVEAAAGRPTEGGAREGGAGGRAGRRRLQGGRRPEMDARRLWVGGKREKKLALVSS
jgi:hypothetical protein